MKLCELIGSRTATFSDYTQWKRAPCSRSLAKTLKGRKGACRLFHGISARNVNNINRYGLNRSYCGVNASTKDQTAVSFWGTSAKTYQPKKGGGGYFARDASYSTRRQSLPTDEDDRGYMFYARVLVGEYTRGNPSMKAPPAKASNPRESYDSTVDRPEDPRQFVMFRDYEFYTQYLIIFKQDVIFIVVNTCLGINLPRDRW